jgi:hypothetical protein
MFYSFNMFIMQCQKVHNCQNVLKGAETGDFLIIFIGVIYHISIYTDTASYYRST